MHDSKGEPVSPPLEVPAESAGIIGPTPSSPVTAEPVAPLIPTDLQQSRSVSSALISTFMSTAVVNMLGVVSGILSARLLGVEARGQLTALTFYPMLFGMLGTLGVQRSLAFELSRRPNDQANLIVSGVTLSIIFSLPLALVGWLVLPALVADDKFAFLNEIRFFSLMMVLQVQIRILQASRQGVFQFKRFNLLRLVPPGVYVISMIVAWQMQWISPRAFAIGYLLGQLVGVSVGVWASWAPLRYGRTIWKEMTLLLEKGLHFHLPEIFGLALDNLDKGLVLAFMVDYDVGLYTVASAIALMQRGVGFAFTETGFVTIAGAKDVEAAKNTLFQQVRVAQVVLFVLGAVFILFTPLIIQFAFGAHYLAAIRTSRILIVAVNLLALVRILDNGLRALGHSWASALSYAAGLLVLAGCGLIYLPEAGVEGMATLLLSAAITALIFCLVFLRVLSKTGFSQMWGFTPGTVRLLYKTIMRRFLRKPAA